MRKLAKSISTAAGEIIQSQKAGPNTTKTHAMSAVVGSLAAYRLPIPTSPVDRPKEWFIINCMSSLEEFVGGINEYCVLDADAAMKIAKAIWESRYSIAHVPSSKEAVSSVMEIVGSGNYRVPEVSADAIRAMGCVNFQELMIVSNELCRGELEFETTGE